MSFTPFTGVDHHKRPVTFCGALVAHEDADSFKWVFTRFLAAMGGKEPNYIITDQDPGILKAVPLVFKTARHRYCMWHIMNKVPSKYEVTRDDYSVFVKKLNAIIWDEDIEAAEFDAKWEEIGREHNVNNIDWFQEMYAKRKQWVMAHCRDLDMGGVMRTTQRSESENTIEVHGAQVYSHKVFEEFQEEVKYPIGTCKSRGFTECDSLEVTTVRDANRDRNYEVTYCPYTLKATCSCRMLERKGILCRHVIWIYSSNGVKIIPEQCVVKRWCRDARLSKMFDCYGEATEDVDIIDGKQIAMSVMWSEIHQTIGMLMGKLKNDVDNFSSLIRHFKEKLSPLGSPLNKQQQLEKILGCSPGQEITILPPKKSKNKGSGKRMLSMKEKAVALARKPKRMCKNCKRLANHDKRNCPNPFAEHPPLSQSLRLLTSDNDTKYEINVYIGKAIFPQKLYY
ncbi:protein FAR-RED IMPAIRED RESPONSE 1-like [Silene latifolia]|uniref:protein FAR-RED IMPAIRED RESPONSE 1-like n=1 Tax=Silene latifolia TaxID=37657 RepID=UPI003D77B6F3